jgi:hypothetical protein
LVAVTVIALGCVRVTDLVAEHPAPSVTVTVYVPAVDAEKDVTDAAEVLIVNTPPVTTGVNEELPVGKQ